MNNKMKTGILIFLGLLTIQDMFTTGMGVFRILGDTTYGMIISGVFAIGVGAMLLSTSSLFHYSKYEKGFFAKILPVIWFIFFIYDVLTSWKGNMYLMFDDNSMNQEQFIILATVTFFVSISAIIISYSLKDD